MLRLDYADVTGWRLRVGRCRRGGRGGGAGQNRSAGQNRGAGQTRGHGGGRSCVGGRSALGRHGGCPFDHVHELHHRRLLVLGRRIACRPQKRAIVVLHPLDRIGLCLPRMHVVVGADELGDHRGDEELFVRDHQRVQDNPSDDDRRGDPQQRHAGREQRRHFIEAAELEQGEGGRHDRDDAGEVNEEKEELIEVVVKDVGQRTEDGSHSLRVGVTLQVGKLAEVEDHIQDDVHPHQDHQADGVVLEEGLQDIPVDDFHRVRKARFCRRGGWATPLGADGSSRRLSGLIAQRGWRGGLRIAIVARSSTAESRCDGVTLNRDQRRRSFHSPCGAPHHALQKKADGASVKSRFEQVLVKAAGLVRAGLGHRVHLEDP